MTTLEFASPGDARSAGAFVSRVLRATGDGVVRVRARRTGAGAGAILLASWLPYDVLVLRGVEGVVAGSGPASRDVVLRADTLLEAVAAGLERIPDPEGGADAVADRDARGVTSGEMAGESFAALAWTGPLPPETGWRHREVLRAGLPGALVDAATRELEGAGGDWSAASVLLSQPVLTVDPDGPDAVAVPLRLIVGAVRMGFLGPDGTDRSVGPEARAELLTTPTWLRLRGPYGDAAVRTADAISVRPR